MNKHADMHETKIDDDQHAHMFSFSSQKKMLLKDLYKQVLADGSVTLISLHLQ